MTHFFFETFFFDTFFFFSETFFFFSGSGGVGSYAIQLAKNLFGCYVATTCSTRNIGHCKKMGADLIINYEHEKWWEVLKEQNYHLILQCIYCQFDYPNAHLVLSKNGSSFVSISMEDEKVTFGYLISSCKNIFFNFFFLIFFFFYFFFFFFFFFF